MRLKDDPESLLGAQAYSSNHKQSVVHLDQENREKLPVGKTGKIMENGLFIHPRSFSLAVYLKSLESELSHIRPFYLSLNEFSVSFYSEMKNLESDDGTEN